MSKIYSVNFILKGKIFETRNFQSNADAIDFIRGHWHHRFWSFKVVCDNEIHKVWYAK